MWIKPAKGPSSIVLLELVNISKNKKKYRPLDSLHQFQLGRCQNGVVDTFGPYSDVFPVIECFDPFMSLERIMFPILNDLDSF